jgi:hypothetical protein
VATRRVGRRAGFFLVIVIVGVPFMHLADGAIR